MTIQHGLTLGLIVLALTGCGKIPLISPNRENFAPWEKLPEGNGITYIEKFTHDPGIDPLYLAKIKYDDEAALQIVVDTFGLKRRADLTGLSTFSHILKNKPSWFPLNGVTHIFEFPEGEHEYESHLWVNADEKTMILERVWW